MKTRKLDRPCLRGRLARQCKICGLFFFLDEDELVGDVCRGCREGQKGMSCKAVHERRKVEVKI